MLTERTSCSTARISVTVIDFFEIGREFSRADIELTDTGHGTVSQGRINDTIVVSAEVYLEFSVLAREGDRYTYRPIGISFREVRGAASADKAEAGHGERDPLGHAAFPMRTAVSRGRTTQLTVYDANPEPATFKFNLIIQRSDGALGIIDPPVENKGRYN